VAFFTGATSLSSDSNFIWDNTNKRIGLGGIASPTQRLSMSGSLIIGNGALGVAVAPNATVGRIDALNDIVAFSSDDRLKTNIEYITSSLERVQQLQGFTYSWNKLAQSLAKYDTSSRHVGVSAQTVRTILPEAVKLAPFDNDGNNMSISGEHYLTVQYEKIVPLLIEAIKELKAEIDKLKQRNFE